MLILKYWTDLEPVLNGVPAGKPVAVYDLGGICKKHLLLFRKPAGATFNISLLCQPGSDHPNLYTATLNRVNFPVCPIVQEQGIPLVGELSDLLRRYERNIDLSEERFHGEDECGVAIGEEQIKGLKTDESFSRYIPEFLKMCRSVH